MLSLRHQGSDCYTQPDPAFRRDVLDGLATTPRRIPARWFYDRTGSELFEAITALPEYYVSRTEQALLSRAIHEIVELAGPDEALQRIQRSTNPSGGRRLYQEAAPSARNRIDTALRLLSRIDHREPVGSRRG